MEGVVADLENENELLSQKILSLESKTKELIQKLSKLQVSNKEYEYNLYVTEEELSRQFVTQMLRRATRSP